MRVLHKKNYIDEAALAATENGATLQIDGLIGLSAHIIWTSTTASFTVKLQTSNDGENWFDESTTQAISNDNGNTILQWAPLHKIYARVVVERTSGTLTTIKVHVAGKDA